MTRIMELRMDILEDRVKMKTILMYQLVPLFFGGIRVCFEDVWLNYFSVATCHCAVVGCSNLDPDLGGSSKDRQKEQSPHINGDKDVALQPSEFVVHAK